MRNLEAKVPADCWGEFKSQASASYTAASPTLAELLRDQLVGAWQRDLPTAVSCFLEDFDACIAHQKAAASPSQGDAKPRTCSSGCLAKSAGLRRTARVEAHVRRLDSRLGELARGEDH